MDLMFNISETQRKKIQQVFKDMRAADMSNGLYEEESCNLAKQWLKDNEQGGVFSIDSCIQSGDISTVVNPCNKEELTRVYLATEQYLERCIETASEHCQTWKLDGLTRAELLLKVAQNIEKQKQLFALLESITTGKPIRRIRSQELPVLIQSFYHFAGWATLWEERMQDWSPLGVVYVIASGYNYPFMSFCWHVAAALAAGNTIILETDPSTYLSASLLAHIMKISGVPKGVFSVFPQYTPFLCEVDATKLKNLSKVFFSGSFEDGQKLRRLNKQLNLEIEIHAASACPTAIVLDGADTDSAVSGILELFCFNDSRTLSAGCRVLVQDCIKESLTQKLFGKFRDLQVGSCLSNSDIREFKVVDTNTSSTCLTLDDIHSEGFHEVVCVQNYSESESVGIPPCIISNVQTSDPFIQKQVGGQFLMIISFRTMKEAIAICNHEKSGCDISIWSEKLAATLQIAHSLKVANVWINCQYLFDSAASYGSVYKSGSATDGGEMGILHFVKPAVRDIKHEEVDPIATDETSEKIDFWNVTFKLYYGGAFKNSDSNTVRKVYSSSECEIGHVPDGSRKDIRNSVEHAVSAQIKWQNETALNRANVLYSIAKGLKSREKEFSNVLHAVTQRPLSDCVFEVRVSVKRLFYWAAMCDKYDGHVKETQMYGKVLETLEPLGVVGIVCPDEFPLLSFVSLISPVIVKGNTVVVVPSEKYPYPALKLCQVFNACGVPGGVINVITGCAKSLTKVLAEHMEVEAVWMHRNCSDCINIVYNSTIMNQKRIWVDRHRNWNCRHQGKGIEFLLRSTYTKTVWLPMGDIFAN